jgi:modulator of FtsH protease HflK
MPWSNQSGGSWNNNNGSGGPWGQGPQAPRGSGSPPDLEEIIRRGQDRLRQALPGGSGGSPLIWIIAAAALVGFWLFQAIYTVQPDQRGVELRFGKPKEEISMPGLHFHWWPIETVEIANIQERQISIGNSSRSGAQAGLMLSGDQNIVDVTFAVLYSVIDPNAYLFNVASSDETIRQVAESAMREVVGRRPAQDIFRDNRAGIADDVRSGMQATLDAYGTGVVINTVTIEDAAPPRPVADAFDEVQRAEQDEDRFVEEAQQYANQKLGAARGEAAQIREEGAAYKDRVVKEAQGEAQRFISVFEEYRKAPQVTRKRLFLETMEGVLRDSNKVIIEQGGNSSGVVPYLPLPEIETRRQGATQ